MSIDTHESIEACSHRMSTDRLGTDCRESGQVGATLMHEPPKMEISHYTLSIVREGELTLYRGRGNGLAPILLVAPREENPSRGSVKQLEREYALRSELDSDWAAKPLVLAPYGDRVVLVLDDGGGEPLDRLLVGEPLAVRQFLRMAIPLANACRRMHGRGLIHKNIKPANVLVDAGGNVRLTGFGIASRLPRERQPPEPSEVIAGTFAYMAPEQTGRMNRSIDARSDLYSLGVTFYEMLTGVLPFTASDALEWVHCHIARKPMSPSERVSEIPGPVADIVLKLLAKKAEDRYQTAAGVEADLGLCLSALEADGRIDPFPLGAHDASDLLLIPEQLYGREVQIDALVTAFDRVVSEGKMELVLVSGYSGIGKSSVVNELHKVLVPPRGLFASGKFDQFKRDIPYSTIAQAFRKLIFQILTKSVTEMDSWRDALREALGSNGQLMVNLIPELAIIVGEQPPVSILPPQEAQARFQTVFRRFLGVFARPEHPLALFLDDLQWLDTATLQLLEHLVTEAEVRHVLLVGAYRDNEVGSSHPLTLTLDAMRTAGVTVQQIELIPLAPADVARLVADSLHCAQERAEPLAQLVYEKTGGNPFFVIQFLTMLADEGLLAFDPEAAVWRWDVARIRSKGFTDNVVDLMAEKLDRLPDKTQKAMRLFACLGNVAEIATLNLIQAGSEEALHAALWMAVRAGLVVRLEKSYAFIHDRVQEAAYRLIPSDELTEVHLNIGRILASRTAPAEIDEKIFEIVNQFNRGASLIHSLEERVQVAELNLRAGRRAKASTAYVSALTYFASGRALLGRESWEHQYRLLFDLELHQGECEFLTGELDAAENRLSALTGRATNLVDRAAATCGCIAVYNTVDRLDRAVKIGLEYLHHVGFEWSHHPTPDDVRHELERMWQLLDGRPIETLIDLPLMSDPDSCATMDVMCELLAPAGFFAPNLVDLVLLRMVNLSLEHGNCDASCFAYSSITMVLGFQFDDYQTAFRFGQLSYDLVEKRGLDRFKARTFMHFGGMAIPWVRHLSAARPLLRRAFEAAVEIGDLPPTICSSSHLITNLIGCAEPLEEIHREIDTKLDFLGRTKYLHAADSITGHLALVRVLRGLTPNFASFDNAEFDERQFEKHLEKGPWGGTALCRYWIRKLQARFFAEENAAAVEASLKAQKLLWSWPSFFEEVDYHFFSALALAAYSKTASDDERARNIEAIVAHQMRISKWAENCPENFQNQAALVAAEIARLESRELEAERFYEDAIQSAREHGFIQNEAIGNELAARFYEARGFATVANAYLGKARACYLRWGADGKVRQLEQSHPQLRLDRRSDSTTAMPVEYFDFATIIKVSQAISSEIDLKKLINTLLALALVHAGAERGLLILVRGEELRIEADAITVGDRVDVELQLMPVTPEALPESVLNYVIRTQDNLLLDNASDQSPFSTDHYIRRYRCQSIFCLPLIKQAKLVGVLYLENRQTSHVFTPARIEVLKLLASQAAISLENAHLYSEQKRVEEALRASEASLAEGQRISHTGTWRWNVRTGAAEWSAECFRIFGANPAVHQPSHSTFIESVHPEDRPQVEQALARASSERSIFKFEFRIVMPNRSIKLLQSTGHPDITPTGELDFIGTAMDVTERRHGEEALRRAQAELAQASRLTAMGELAGSIVHEINQPLAAMMANAETCLLWLDRDQPNLGEARQAVARLWQDSRRAADVVKGLRALARRSDLELESVDITGAIREVLDVLRGELERGAVALHIDLCADDRPVLGDRVQLQQVLLNLIRNGIEAMSEVTDRSRALSISSKPTEQAMLVAVADTGIGLSPAIADRLFDPMFTTKHNGMGMGLSICRSIIEAHRGRIWAAKNMPYGSIFSFTMPA
jgi:predicted ATPase/signal transduction histidine kinase/GAF domain-containing protein